MSTDKKEQTSASQQSERILKLRDDFKDLEVSFSIQRESLPLVTDLLKRMVVGAGAGFGLGFYMFKSWDSTKFTTLFGLGVGLGLNYTQLRVLYHSARGTLEAENEKN
mmetsp:Transcript_14091/g.23930  ORF Transcript_14091/g.23930 Transcript_14091/m.23930 type:complete len:108 (+) Transcript_14091:18-341(+)